MKFSRIDFLGIFSNKYLAFISLLASSSDTVSINIDSATNSSADENIEELIRGPKKSGNRPATAVAKTSEKVMVKRRATSTKETCRKGDGDGKKQDEDTGDKKDDHIAERDADKSDSFGLNRSL